MKAQSLVKALSHVADGKVFSQGAAFDLITGRV